MDRACRALITRTELQSMVDARNIRITINQIKEMCDRIISDAHMDGGTTSEDECAADGNK